MCAGGKRNEKKCNERDQSGDAAMTNPRFHWRSLCLCRLLLLLHVSAATSPPLMLCLQLLVWRLSRQGVRNERAGLSRRRQRRPDRLRASGVPVLFWVLLIPPFVHVTCLFVSGQIFARPPGTERLSAAVFLSRCFYGLLNII